MVTFVTRLVVFGTWGGLIFGTGICVEFHVLVLVLDLWALVLLPASQVLAAKKTFFIATAKSASILDFTCSLLTTVNHYWWWQLFLKTWQLAIIVHTFAFIFQEFSETPQISLTCKNQLWLGTCNHHLYCGIWTINCICTCSGESNSSPGGK